MKNIVITAGGTSEYIDTVRKITNSGTGKLGSMIANELSKNDDNNIFYICSPKAIRPEKRNNVNIIQIEGTIQLKETVEKILTTNKIDWFIHSMAVSDYVVDYVSTADMLNEFLQKEGLSSLNIQNNEKVFNRNEKISSSEENLIIKLKKAPKVIKLIKELSPETKLIGFKLLTGVPEKELIDVAYKLMSTNNCDYVVANDLNNISSDSHKALILSSENKEISRVNTKNEITKNIKNIIA